MRLFEVWWPGAVLLVAIAVTAHAQETRESQESVRPAQPNQKLRPQDGLLDKTFSFDVEAQLVSTAVIELSKQAGIQVAMTGGDLDASYTYGIRGNFSLRDALTKLLEGTNFEFIQTGAKTVTIKAGLVRSPASDAGHPSPGPEWDQIETVEQPEPAPEPEQVETIPVAPAEASREVQYSERGDATLLEPMIVTAGKREQDLRMIAASVSALSGDKLEGVGAQSFEDYLKLVPGVTMNRQSGDKSAPIIRGIASGTLPGIGSRTTGIFVDEIPLNDLFLVSANIDMNPFDLDRVEVMKGPQGTLFGSSAIAGAIRYITHKPESSVWQAKILGTYTTTEQGEKKPLGAAMINIPIGNSAAVRAVGLVRESPGYIDDLGRGLKDVGGIEQTTSRVLGTWQPLDRLNLTGTWLAQDSYVPDAEFADQTERLERSNTNGPNLRQSDFSVANLVGTYDFDWGTLLSNTSQVTKDNFILINADRGLPGQGETGPEDQSQPILNSFALASTTGIVQELRLSAPADSGRWQWVAGLAYLSFDSFNTSNNSGPLIPPVGDGAATIAFTVFDAVASESALFAETTATFWDDWEFTVGGRYFQTGLVADTLIRGATQLLNGQTEARSHLTLKDNGFNPKLSVRYSLNENATVYALAARGFQFGGVQLAPPSRTNDTLVELGGGPKFEPYDSSTLWNIEIGARTEWWNGRLQFDATLFHMIWKDLQLVQLVFSQGRAITAVVTNVGEAHSDGVELALRVAPQRGISLLSTASFVNAATAVPLEISEGRFPAGTQLPGSAKFQMASTLAYERPFSFLGNWAAGASLTYAKTSRIFNDLEQSAEFGDYDTFDFGVHLLNDDLRFQPKLTLSVANLLDTRGVSGISTGRGFRFADVYFIRPRTSTLSLTVGF